MRREARAFLAGCLAVLVTVPVTLRAQGVQLTLHDGRVSLVAVNATPAEIFEAWSRTGDVQVFNAEQLAATRQSLTLEDVPEEQALDTLLRPVTGYLARRRTGSAQPSDSMFDRIVIMPAPAAARPAAAPGARPNVQPAPPPPPLPFPQAPEQPQGVERIIGADGQPVDDDQVGAPPPPPQGADAPSEGGRARPVPVPGGARTPQYPQQPPPQQPQSPPAAQGQPGAPPVGAPQPGMVVPVR